MLTILDNHNNQPLRLSQSFIADFTQIYMHLTRFNIAGMQNGIVLKQV